MYIGTARGILRIRIARATSCTPYVLSFSGRAAEIIERGKNGMVIDDPSDPRQVAESINHLLDPAIRQSMGPRARELAERFTLERNAGEMIKLYKELAEKK